MKLQGLPVDRSTLAFWVGVAAAELKPIYVRMKELLLGSAKIADGKEPVCTRWPKVPRQPCIIPKPFGIVRGSA